MLSLTTFPAEVREGAHGAGLYATADLRAGTAVARFDGPILPPGEVPEEEVRYALVLDATAWQVPSTPARYINHACDPNCYVRDDGEVVTLRPVALGEGLTFDYARVDAADYLADPAAHGWDPRWTFECGCGSALCRGAIDGYVLVGAVRDFPSVPPLTVAEVAGKGRGVVAARAITAGERVERAPVMVIPGRDWPRIEPTVLFDYTFEWGEDGQDAAVVLGTGSLINHAYRPNAMFVRRYAAGEVDFVALRDIAPGEEVTVNYHGDDDASPLWFNVVE